MKISLTKVEVPDELLQAPYSLRPSQILRVGGSVVVTAALMNSCWMVRMKEVDGSRDLLDILLLRFQGS